MYFACVIETKPVTKDFRVMCFFVPQAYGFTKMGSSIIIALLFGTLIVTWWHVIERYNL